MRKVEYEQRLAPAKWWKRIGNVLWRFFNSPSENVLELLPTLDENQIIGITTEALGATTSAHRHFQQNEPVPEQDGSFVPLKEIVVQNPAKNNPSPARMIGTGRGGMAETLNLAPGKTLNSSASEVFYLNRVSPNLSSRLPPITHEGRTVFVTPTASTVASSSSARRINHVKVPLDEPEETLQLGSFYTSRMMTKKREYLWKLEIGEFVEDELGGKGESANLNLPLSCEATTQLSATAIQPKLVAAPSRVSPTTTALEHQRSRGVAGQSVVKEPSVRVSVEESLRDVNEVHCRIEMACVPPPVAAEEATAVSPLAAGEAGTVLTKKAVAQAVKDQGLSGLTAAASKRAEMKLHDKKSSAVVEDWGPAPAFDEEDMKMAEDLEAGRRTNKMATQSSCGQDDKHTVCSGLTASSHSEMPRAGSSRLSSTLQDKSGEVHHDNSLKELFVVIDERDLRTIEMSTSTFKTKRLAGLTPSQATASVPFRTKTASVPFRTNIQDAVPPLSAFEQEDMKMAEALEATRRAKKAASRSAKAQGSPKTSPAVVGDLGPAPAFDEEDMKMAEALEATRRAKKGITKK